MRCTTSQRLTRNTFQSIPELLWMPLAMKVQVALKCFLRETVENENDSLWFILLTASGVYTHQLWVIDPTGCRQNPDDILKALLLVHSRSI